MERPATDHSRLRYFECEGPQFFVAAWATSDGTGCSGKVDVSVQFDPVHGQVSAIASWANRVGHCPTFRDAWCCGQGDDRTATPHIRWGQDFQHGDCSLVEADALPGFQP